MKFLWRIIEKYMRIVGLDIRPDRNSFALAILEGKQVRVQIVHSSLLLRTLEQLKPDIIAIDDESEFKNLERIAEVTGATIVKAGIRGQRIYETARKAGIWSGGHPSPAQTAVLVAKLASLGLYEVIYSGVRETVIRITPERASYRGGRESKYKRSLKVFLEHAKEEVEQRLRSEGIEFDAYARGNSFEIRAYENVNLVRETLKGIDVQDVRLDVHASKPVRTSLKGKFIVGIDPGTHVGLAFVNIYGDLVHSATLEGGRESAISYIRSVGDPILLAVDVPEVPDFVKRIAAAVKAPIYAPDSPISLEEKRRIASEYALKGSPHERDALAAAVKAYYKYKPKIDRAIKAAREFGLPPEEVVYLVLRNHSVMGAISKLLPKPKEEPSKRPKRQKSREELEREVESLREELRRLRKVYQKTLEELEEYKLELELMRSEQHKEVLREILLETQREKIEALENEVKRLRKRVEKLEETLEGVSNEAHKTLENVAFGKYLRDLTRSSLEELAPIKLVKGDVLFVASAKSDSKTLKEISKAAYILAPRNVAKDIERLTGVRVIPRELVTRKRMGPFVIFERDSFRKALKKIQEEDQKRLEKIIKNIIFEISGSRTFRARV